MVKKLLILGLLNITTLFAIAPVELIIKNNFDEPLTQVEILDATGKSALTQYGEIDEIKPGEEFSKKVPLNSYKIVADASSFIKELFYGEKIKKDLVIDVSKEQLQENPEVVFAPRYAKIPIFNTTFATIDLQDIIRTTPDGVEYFNFRPIQIQRNSRIETILPLYAIPSNFILQMRAIEAHLTRDQEIYLPNANSEIQICPDYSLMIAPRGSPAMQCAAQEQPATLPPVIPQSAAKELESKERENKEAATIEIPVRIVNDSRQDMSVMIHRGNLNVEQATRATYIFGTNGLASSQAFTGTLPSAGQYTLLVANRNGIGMITFEITPRADGQPTEIRIDDSLFEHAASGLGLGSEGSSSAVSSAAAPASASGADEASPIEPSPAPFNLPHINE